VAMTNHGTLVGSTVTMTILTKVLVYIFDGTVTATSWRLSMFRFGFVTALATAALLGPVAAAAQGTPRVNTPGRASPHETVSASFGPQRNRVTITYGRPFTKDPRTGEPRKIWGTLVPWGKAWRMGADEATTLITQATLDFGGTTVPPGAYTLYFVSDESGAAKIAFSKKIGGWGIPVDESQDVARIYAKRDTLAQPVDQFTIVVERGASNNGAGTIKLMWENTQYSVPFTIK
jgi:hypothetical protein